MQKRVYRKGWYISFKKEWRNPGNDRSQKFETDNQQADLNTIASVSDIPSFESQYIENGFFDSVPKTDSKMEELPVGTVFPVVENEDTISEITAGSERLSAKPSKASTRPDWTKKLAIFLFCASIILMIALLIATSPVDLATSTMFAGIMLAVVFLAFLIGLSVYNNKKKSAKKKPLPEKKMRLMTQEEQAEKNNRRKRGAIVITIFTGIVFLLFVMGAITMSTYLFLIPVALITAFFIILAWVEFKRPRSLEMTEDNETPEKQYRQKTDAEMQKEIRLQKRKSIASAIFWTLVLAIILLIAIPIESYLLLFFGGLICLAFILGACLEYFRWKPEDSVEIVSVSQQEPLEEGVEKQKPVKTPEEQRKLNRKRNIVVGLFFAIIAAFFIFSAKN
ncbi:MAG: hypothetical protein A3D31_17020 [Candidatus Fluviicola riflensis]|nr:MAG: hypothetical protein CHH17_01960 [Candidatus Fluviicola riflensis]OGS76691.1 MAG: hypothetical protein A3D31_17020 [Candidatus Fluviicola riflensis]OGS82954.1 MAG: hypothetical protein A2724_14340 [Fluviicola sp. RIFCSPHIGHO2_01_FULL_43_53]OGS88422.1 MAG: hypothetical protein A3E30_06525 [Fluviicola sp. RIFCSPHIGHO2_12_FULL_43_24]